MRVTARGWMLRSVALTMGMWALAVLGGSAADNKSPLLPDADYPKMLVRNVKSIEAALKGSPSPEKAEKARTDAVLIAAYAQQNLSGADGAERATVRDAALKTADLIKEKKYAEAAKLAATLPKLKANPSAKKEPVKLIDTYVTYADLMHQFRMPAEGGWRVFAHLQELQTNKDYRLELPRKEMDQKFILEAYQVAVTANLAHQHVHKTRPKEWEKYTAEMQQYAEELANVLKAKDTKAAPVALSKLTTSCFNCHKTFKVKNTGVK